MRVEREGISRRSQLDSKSKNAARSSWSQCGSPRPQLDRNRNVSNAEGCAEEHECAFAGKESARFVPFAPPRPRESFELILPRGTPRLVRDRSCHATTNIVNANISKSACSCKRKICCKCRRRSRICERLVPAGVDRCIPRSSFIKYLFKTSYEIITRFPASPVGRAHIKD
jgi:hypothetical protein